MELHDVGRHCAFCNALDYLPHHCPNCDQHFCSRHRMRDTHACETIAEDAVPPTSSHNGSIAITSKCQVEGCSDTSVTVTPCPDCGSGHCLKHRHPSEHNCPRLDAAKTEALFVQEKISTRQEEAARRLEQAREVAIAKRDKRRPIMSEKKRKTAALVAQMKLKGSATGDKSVGDDERFYLRIFLDEDAVSDVAPTSKPLFFAARLSLGKVLDLAASSFGSTVQPTAKTGQDLLRAYRCDDLLAIPHDQSLRQLQTSGLLPSGSSVVLSRAPTDQLQGRLYKA